MAEAKEVCRIYRNTKNCRYGAECRFEHSEGEPIAQPPRKLGECFTYRDTQACKFGEKCRFLHGPSDPRVDETGALKRNLTDEICRNYQRNVCRFGDECRRKHEGPVDADAPPADGAAAGGARPRRRRRPRGTSQSQGTAPAANKPAASPSTQSGAGPAAEAGGATTGAPRRRRVRRRGPRNPASGAQGGAPASTDGAAAPAASGQAGGAAPARRRAPRGASAPRGPRIPNDQIVDEEGREVCRTYYHLHRCRFADNCRYIHVAGPNPIQDTQSSEARPPRGPRAPREPRPSLECRNFATEGKCSFGELCRFKHGEADQRDMADVQAKNRARAAQLRESQAAAPAQQ